MRRTRIARDRLEELRKNLQEAQASKKKIIEYLDKLKEVYSKKKISYATYTETLHYKRDGRNLHEWIECYEKYTKEYKKQIRKQQANIAKKHTLNILIFSAIIFVIIFSIYHFQPRFTGLVIQTPTENMTEIVSESTTQLTKQITLNQPVQWKKHIEVKEQGIVKIKLPGQADKINVNKISYSENKGTLQIQEDSSPSQEESPSSETQKFSTPVTGAVISTSEEGFLIKFFTKLQGAITGRAIQEQSSEIKEITIDDTATEYEIEYETPAPYAEEKEITNGKQIKIIGPETIHYENVLAYTELPREVSKEKIKLYRTTDRIREPTAITNYIDENKNGLIDKIEWIVPSLSEQTYELEIVIINAEHLDENKEFISNIYDYVNETDGIAYTIPENEYARAYFERNLTNKNKIDVYVTNSEPAKIEVYEENSDIIVGSADVSGEGRYYVSLDFEGSQSIFDLKSVGGDIIYDYIHDADSYNDTINSFNPDHRWPLDGDETDIIGSADRNDGTSPSYVDNIISESEYPQCGDYDGSSSVSKLASATDINTGTTTQKSISLWFIADTIDTSGNGRILWEEGATYHGIGIYVSDAEGSDKVYCTLGTNSGSTLDTVSADISTGVLYHLVVTIDVTTSEMILYLDGSAVDTESSMSAPNPIPAHSSDPAIGGADSGPRNYNSDTLSGYFDGRIADVVYYAEQDVLTGDDVSAIYNAGAGGGADEINPDINITFPTNNTNWSNVNLDVNYTRSDDQGLFNCWYSNDTYLVNTSLGATCDNVTNVVWSEGNHNVTIWANDTSGNYNFSSVSFTTDTIKPAIAIVSPTNNTNTSDVNLDISYTRSDSGTGLFNCWYSNDTYSVNTSLANCGNITDVVWSQGLHNVAVWANDSAGNYNFSSISFTIDSVLPTVTIDSPSNHTNTTDTGLDVTYTATDANLKSCWYHNDTKQVNVSLANCNTDITTVTWSEGQHNVTVWANDSVGNEQRNTIFFTIDETNPSVSILFPTNATNSSNVNLNINFTRSDNIFLETCWYSNDTYLKNTVLASGENVSSVTWSEGFHTVSIWCNDSAGNEDTKNVSFTIDVTNPSVTITFPTNATNSSNVNLNVNFTRSDTNLETCWYSNDTYSKKTILSSGENITGVTWTNEFHTVSVWCNDSAGNEDTKNVSFTIDSINPDLNITYPINNTKVVGVNADVNFTRSDANLESCWYSNDSRTVNSTPDSTCNNITSIVWTLGLHNITVYVNDSANNLNWSTINFTIVSANNAPNDPSPDINSSDGTNLTIKNLNCFDTITDPDAGDKLNVTVRWYNSSHLAWELNYDSNYASGADFNAVLDSANTTKGENWSCSLRLYDGTAYSNWVNSSYTVNITNSNPNITHVFNESMTHNATGGLNSGPAFTSVTINFTAYDADGTSDLDSNTATINLTKTGETTRQNTSCSQYESSGNYANYTCNITMWWWDAPGTWDITAFIKDEENNATVNSSTDMQVGETTGFELSPSLLAWPDVAAGSSNLTSNNDPIVLNNTGNKNISANTIQINATNLLGEEDDSYGLRSGNFSMSWETGGSCSGATCVECAGSQMNVSTGNYANITLANLTRGNFSINDGSTGQEQLYVCLRLAGNDLITQPYSTANQGAWTIRVLLVAVIPKRRRKKKQKEKQKNKKKSKAIEDDKLLQAFDLIAEELKTEYSLNKKELLQIIIEKLKEKHNISRKEISEIVGVREKVQIPATIFSKKLGALESITKYMKENLNMNYHEIAKKLGRNERTVWTAYKKATEKQKEPLKIKKTEFLLPISIFENKKLTILESVIVYLKEGKGMKYHDIAHLLDRDQRNIWTICSRAVKKLIKTNNNI